MFLCAEAEEVVGLDDGLDHLEVEGDSFILSWLQKEVVYKEPGRVGLVLIGEIRRIKYILHKQEYPPTRTELPYLSLILTPRTRILIITHLHLDLPIRGIGCRVQQPLRQQRLRRCPQYIIKRLGIVIDPQHLITFRIIPVGLCKVVDIHLYYRFVFFALLFWLLSEAELYVFLPRPALLKCQPAHKSNREPRQHVVLILQIGVVVLCIRRVLGNKLIEVEHHICQEQHKEHCCPDQTLSCWYGVVFRHRYERKDIHFCKDSHRQRGLLLLDEWLFHQRLEKGSLLGLLLFTH